MLEILIQGRSLDVADELTSHGLFLPNDSEVVRRPHAICVGDDCIESLACLLDISEVEVDVRVD